MIFLAGTSGAGKTTFINRFVERHPEFTHLSVSSVLRSLGRPTNGASVKDLDENQRLIVNFVLKGGYKYKSILDGHMVIPTDNRNYMVPIDVVMQLPISLLIFLREDSGTIANRKDIPNTLANTSSISRVQEIELLHMHKAAIAKGCPLLSIDARQSIEIDRWLLHYGMV
jgi:adenylate kinase